MTPAKCASHELRPGEYADSLRYQAALIASRTCVRCRAKAFLAITRYRLAQAWARLRGKEDPWSL